MNKLLNIIKQLEDLGYKYYIKRWPDGTAMSYKFSQQDSRDPESFWEICIEDHHGEADTNGVYDWLIYCSCHDPEQKDFDGNQIDTRGAVEFKTMKLIMEFIEEIEKED